MTSHEFKAIRKKTGLSQSSFGKLIRKSERMVRYYESGKYDIGYYLAEHLNAIYSPLNP